MDLEDSRPLEGGARLRSLLGDVKAHPNSQPSALVASYHLKAWDGKSLAHADDRKLDIEAALVRAAATENLWRRLKSQPLPKPPEGTSDLKNWCT